MSARPAFPVDRRRSALAVLWRTARSGTRPGTPGLGARARSLPAMVSDSVGGRYRGPGRPRLAGAAAGLVYLLSPLDVVPEAVLPLVGVLDDAVVAAWVAGALLTATEDYALWRSRRVAGPGGVDTGPGGTRREHRGRRTSS
ncbi:YkvA family protein [Kineococcus auxinigenes]|uniref:YkvA family protein n=1 Tax=unclassified Kineococcus TaxID=2621656 RepID=UPI003D7C9DF3